MCSLVVEKVGSMGNMLLTHPRCFPGTQKVSNYLKCVWSMASTDPCHNFCINSSIYYFYPPMVQNNEFILLCTLLFCNVRLRNQFWLQEHFRTFFSSIAWYWTVFWTCMVRIGVWQSRENVQFFLGTKKTFQKFPTLFAIYIPDFGLLCTEWVVHIVSELKCLA